MVSAVIFSAPSDPSAPGIVIDPTAKGTIAPSAKASRPARPRRIQATNVKLGASAAIPAIRLAKRPRHDRLSMIEDKLKKGREAAGNFADAAVPADGFIEEEVILIKSPGRDGGGEEKAEGKQPTARRQAGNRGHNECGKDG